MGNVNERWKLLLGRYLLTSNYFSYPQGSSYLFYVDVSE